MLAVTAQNPGIDGVYLGGDDEVDGINMSPSWIAHDPNPGPNCADLADRVRGFYSLHAAGANFAFGDSSTRFIGQSVDGNVYRSLSTMAGQEIIDDEY